MNYSLETVGGAPVSSDEFADRHELQMIVRERPRRLELSRFYASFDGTEVKGDGVLIGMSGNGNSPEEAITDYLTGIRGQVLVVDAWNDKRREIECPNDWVEP